MLLYSDENIIAGVNSLGIDKLSKIQAHSIPKLLFEDGNKAILNATGSGKTLAYSIAAINHVDVTKKTPQVICLCATYEAALQTSWILKRVATFTDVNIGMAVQDSTGNTLDYFINTHVNNN